MFGPWATIMFGTRCSSGSVAELDGGSDPSLAFLSVPEIHIWWCRVHLRSVPEVPVTALHPFRSPGCSGDQWPRSLQVRSPASNHIQCPRGRCYGGRIGWTFGSQASSMFGSQVSCISVPGLLLTFGARHSTASVAVASTFGAQCSSASVAGLNSGLVPDLLQVGYHAPMLAGARTEHRSVPVVRPGSVPKGRVVRSLHFMNSSPKCNVCGATNASGIKACSLPLCNWGIQ